MLTSDIVAKNFKKSFVQGKQKAKKNNKKKTNTSFFPFSIHAIHTRKKGYK